jgi:thiol-disulfide isomerase/thioredoxin
MGKPFGSERQLVSRRCFVAGALLSCVATVGGVTPASANGARSGPWCRELTKLAREDNYNFSLHLLDSDNIFTLSDLAGRPVWLNFFTSWCPPCNAEAADIVRVAAKYGDTLHVVGIDVKEDADPVRDFRDRHKIPFPIALDSHGRVFHALGFSNWPTHIFLDSRGLISCISIGDLTPDEMDNEIAVALERAPLAPAGASPSPVPGASGA